MPPLRARPRRSHESQTRNRSRPRTLDRRFDAAVWARIDAENARATNPVAQSAVATTGLSRWVFMSNVVGIGVAAVLVIVFGLRSLSGVEMNIPMPQLSAATTESLSAFGVPAITAGALLFGLMFTPLGRRLRAEFS